MSLEENKAIVRKWIEATNKKDLAVLDELIALEFFHHTVQLGGEDFKQYVALLIKGFPAQQSCMLFSQFFLWPFHLKRCLCSERNGTRNADRLNLS